MKLAYQLIAVAFLGSSVVFGQGTYVKIPQKVPVESPADFLLKNRYENDLLTFQIMDDVKGNEELTLGLFLKIAFGFENNGEYVLANFTSDEAISEEFVSKPMSAFTLEDHGNRGHQGSSSDRISIQRYLERHLKNDSGEQIAGLLFRNGKPALIAADSEEYYSRIYDVSSWGDVRKTLVSAFGLVGNMELDLDSDSIVGLIDSSTLRTEKSVTDPVFVFQYTYYGLRENNYSVRLIVGPSNQIFITAPEEFHIKLQNALQVLRFTESE